MAQDRLVIGIDLGTTNSCVGVWLNGRVEIVPSDQGTRTTPSCVAFTDCERLIGEGANHQVATNASNTVFDVKRIIGRSFSDASVKRDAKYWPFGVIEGTDDKPKIKVSYLGGEKEFSPEEISAMVLLKMKETAEAYVGRTITDAVITVPAYFNGSQRQATKDAGIIAGLNVLRIINEPTAAAIAYSFDTKWRERPLRESTVLVYDLGGGTLDVSLVAINRVGLSLQVIATAGDTHLGGEDFTNNMVDHFVHEFKKKNPHISGDISSDKKALGRLRRSCEDAKRRLSTNPRFPVEVDALFEGIDFHSEITRDKFEELNEDLFIKCREPIAKCLMEEKQVDDVVLVGGSTRIPRVQKLVRDFFRGKELCRNINADEAVAYGATIQAAILTIKKAPQVFDITPFSQGIGLLEGLMCEAIPRSTTIPTTKEVTFVTVKDNQSSMDMTVYEDERAIAKFRTPLDPRFKVLFEIDQDGILHISVQDKEGRITINNPVGRFSTEEIKIMKDDAQRYKDQDEEHNKNVQARNDIQNLLFTISNNRKNLEDSVARLLVHPVATREQERETPGLQDSPSNWTKLRVGMPQKAQDKGKRIQAHTDTIKKLQYQINKLQQTADEITKCLAENKELATSLIVDQKKQIEDDYHSICGQIESASQSKFNKSFQENEMFN